MKKENDIFQIEGKVLADPWMISPAESIKLHQLPEVQREEIMKMPAQERREKLKKLFPK